MAPKARAAREVWVNVRENITIFIIRGREM